jgi:hypothetical protein
MYNLRLTMFLFGCRLPQYFGQVEEPFLSILGVSNIRQTEIPTAEPLVAEPSAIEVLMAAEKLRKTQITKF